MADAPQFALSEAIDLGALGGSAKARLAGQERRRASAATGTEFRGPRAELARRRGRKRTRGSARSDPRMANFRLGDRVSFTNAYRRQIGVIIRLGRKRALLQCDNGQQFQVPYVLLTAADSTEDRGDSGRLGAPANPLAPPTAPPLGDASQFALYDAVQFVTPTGPATGHIAKKGRRHATVVTGEGTEFRVPWALLARQPGGEPRRVSTRSDQLKASFRPGDRVSFENAHGPQPGAILRLGPKRALVRCDNRAEYYVPYEQLTAADSNGDGAAGEQFGAPAKLPLPATAPALADATRFALYDAVQFPAPTGLVTGHIAKKDRRYALVVTESGAEFRVPWARVARQPGGEPRRVSTRHDQLKANFRPGDRVSFDDTDGPQPGFILRLGPKRALVRCDNRKEFYVPYGQLTPAHSNGGRNDDERLAAIAKMAEGLIAEHGLAGWSVQFDDASRRAGQCDYVTKVIGLTRLYCLTASEAEVRNTVLHEIAHALVGPRHHHDKVWKAQARAIGCTGDRCHTVEFGLPRYIQVCKRCGWMDRAHTRQRLICKACEQPVSYTTFTQEAWEGAKLLGFRP